MEMLLQPIGLSIQTMYADLIQRSLDAAFDADFPENGSFYKQSRKGKDYWYYNGYDSEGKRQVKYVGQASDPAVSDRVAKFGRIKSGYSERRSIVRALAAAGLPTTDPLTGSLLEALGKAGLFRLRACLVGTVAYQTYSGLLGVKLPNTQLMTLDADIAQFLAISAEVGDSVPEMIGLLRTIDKTFLEIPHQIDGRRTVAYRNAAGYKVEFLVPNYSKEEYESEPPVMPALGGAAAQPLRFLEFLIHLPIRAVLLHNAGIPVTVPAPERYAVHKLIVATRRNQDNAAKINKDLAQAGTLIEAMLVLRRHQDLLDAWGEAWGRGPSWREALMRGREMLAPDEKEILAEAIARACEARGERTDAYGFTKGAQA